MQVFINIYGGENGEVHIDSPQTQLLTMWISWMIGISLEKEDMDRRYQLIRTLVKTTKEGQFKYPCGGDNHDTGGG